ncbi:unnamed protein product [Rotaria sp. Silwood1]|nr:unnamed protein product [Rotaria sp. Silwood1]
MDSSTQQEFENTNNDSEFPIRRANARLVIPDSEDLTIADPIIGYAKEPLIPLKDACIPLVPIVYNILVYASVALEHTPDNPANGAIINFIKQRIPVCPTYP